MSLVIPGLGYTTGLPGTGVLPWGATPPPPPPRPPADTRPVPIYSVSHTTSGGPAVIGVSVGGVADAFARWFLALERTPAPLSPRYFPGPWAWTWVLPDPIGLAPTSVTGVPHYWAGFTWSRDPFGVPEDKQRDVTLVGWSLIGPADLLGVGGIRRDPTTRNFAVLQQYVWLGRQLPSGLDTLREEYLRTLDRIRVAEELGQPIPAELIRAMEVSVKQWARIVWRQRQLQNEHRPWLPPRGVGGDFVVFATELGGDP